MAGLTFKLGEFGEGVTFYHVNDARAFFAWLEAIPCVASVEGEGWGYIVTLTRAPRKDDILQFVALCMRYGISTAPLEQFQTSRNRAWFEEFPFTKVFPVA